MKNDADAYAVVDTANEQVSIANAKLLEQLVEANTNR